MQYGHFDNENREYVTDRVDLPEEDLFYEEKGYQRTDLTVCGPGLSAFTIRHTVEIIMN